MPVPIVPCSTALVECTPRIDHVLGTLIIYGALGHNITLLSRDCELFIETKAFFGSWRSILRGTDLPKGAQRQLVCSGCRNLLLYAPGATSVCCSVCNVVTSVPPSGAQMAQLICGGCHTQLMYIRSANSVQCPRCHTVNLALEENQVAHVNCGNCFMLLMYRRGGRSVKCAVCNFVTSVGV